MSVSVAALPVPPALAQSATSSFTLSDASCTSLLSRAGALQNPGYAQNLNRNLTNTERMKTQVDQRKGTIDRSLLQQMHDQAREYVDGLSDALQFGADQLGDEELQRFVRSLNDRGIYPEPAKLATLREFESAMRDLVASVRRLGQVRNLRLTQYVERVDAAMGAYDRAQAAYEKFVKDWISDAQLKDYAEVAASLGARALGELAYRLAFMAATSNPIAFDRTSLTNDEIARLQQSIDGAREQQRRVDSDRNAYERQHQNYCKQSTQQAGRPGEQPSGPGTGQPGTGQPGGPGAEQLGGAGAAAETATSSTGAPSAPGSAETTVASTPPSPPPAPTPGGGGGAALALLGILGLTAAAVALAGGAADTSTPTSSSSSSSCPSRAECCGSNPVIGTLCFIPPSACTSNNGCPSGTTFTGTCNNSAGCPGPQGSRNCRC